MRIRNKPWAKEELDKSSIFIKNPEEHKGKWTDLFKNNKRSSFEEYQGPNDIIDNMPVGINITGKFKDDINVLNIAYAIENKLSFKGQVKEVK